MLKGSVSAAQQSRARGFLIPSPPNLSRRRTGNWVTSVSKLDCKTGEKTGQSPKKPGTRLVTASCSALCRGVQATLRHLAVIAMPALLATECAQANEWSYSEFEPVDGPGTAYHRTVADRALTIPLKE